MQKVLRPCTVSVAGSTPEGKGLHIDVHCTDIYISVSPGMHVHTYMSNIIFMLILVIIRY